MPDLTGEHLKPVSELLLDKDVIKIIETAYGDEDLNALASDDDIMASFWKDVYAGKRAMQDISEPFYPGDDDYTTDQKQPGK